jgi:hypothetical protein
MRVRASILSAEPIQLSIAALLLFLASVFELEYPTTTDNGIRFAIDAGFEYEYGMLFSILALASAFLGLAGKSVKGELRAQLYMQPTRVGQHHSGPSATPDSKALMLTWMLGTIGIGAGLGIRFIGQPVGYDEAFTFMFFLNGT